VSYDGVRACLECLPGIVFECSDPEAAAMPDLTPQPSAETPLPTSLRSRIRQAAIIHNATALRSCLREVEELGAAQRPWLDLLRRALQSYDMQAIVSFVSQES
jgi:hypothetical protein